MYIFLALISAVLATVRNAFSKCISDFTFGTKAFYMAQTVIFSLGSIILILITDISLSNISLLTVIYGALYGIFLILAQYCYTASLKFGNIGVCSTVYSLGFVIPTVAGTVICSERLTMLNVIGALLVIVIVIVFGHSSSCDKKAVNKGGYVIFLIIAMISSGVLGILQKLQQNSPYPEQRGFFVSFAFSLAGIISFAISLLKKKDNCYINHIKLIPASIAGIAFGSSNLLNTFLAGKLSSMMFFPLLNISTILMSIFSGCVFYRERLSKKDYFVIIAGTFAIVLISF